MTTLTISALLGRRVTTCSWAFVVAALVAALVAVATARTLRWFLAAAFSATTATGVTSVVVVETRWIPVIGAASLAFTFSIRATLVAVPRAATLVATIR